MKAVIIKVICGLAALAGCAGKHSVNDQWSAELVDGRNVQGRELFILVADERITGGRDGCNGWSFDGAGRVVSEMAGCPPDRNRDRDAYWTVVKAVRALPARVGKTLLLEANGHAVSFRRTPITLTGSQ